MSDTKKRKLNEDCVSCIICNSFKDKLYITFEPKPESYLVVQRAALRRRDDVTQRFQSQYNADASNQTFSWHKSCYASYTSEQKIKRRENALLKVQCLKENKTRFDQGSTSGIKSNLRTPLKILNDQEGNICIICNNQSKNHDFKTHLILQTSRAEA